MEQFVGGCPDLISPVLPCTAQSMSVCLSVLYREDIESARFSTRGSEAPGPLTPWSGLKTTFSNLNLVICFYYKIVVFRRFQPAIYTVVHEESESEVQNTQILQENLKISISKFKKIWIVEIMFFRFS